MIYLKQSDFDAMLAHGQKELPNEACGLIAGTERDGDRYVEKVYLLENEDHSPEHFTMSPAAQLQAIRDMRQNGLKPLGNFHTHPSTPSRPSEEDQRLALDPRASYLILSLMEEGNPVLHSFHMEGGQSTIEELSIYDDVPDA